MNKICKACDNFIEQSHTVLKFLQIDKKLNKTIAWRFIGEESAQITAWIDSSYFNKPKYVDSLLACFICEKRVFILAREGESGKTRPGELVMPDPFG